MDSPEHTYKHTRGLTVKLRSSWHLSKIEINACPFRVWAGHAVPFTLRRRPKWLLTQVDSKLSAPTRTLIPSCCYNTIRRTINIPNTSGKKKRRGGGSISSLNCENHKEDVIKQKCLGTHAERWVLNRGGRALLKWHRGQPLNSCMRVPSVIKDGKWRAI